MNFTIELTLADAVAQVYYWPLRYLAWLLWGLIFGGIGMAAVWFLWKGRRLHAEELDNDNKQLRRELEEMERQLKSRSQNGSGSETTRKPEA